MKGETVSMRVLVDVHGRQKDGGRGGKVGGLGNGNAGVSIGTIIIHSCLVSIAYLVVDREAKRVVR